MIPLSIQFGPYSFLGALLSLASLVNVVFMLRFEHKTTTTWFWIAALAGFTASMLALFLSVTLVAWGCVFAPQQDAWVVFSMTAVTGLIYQYPEKEVSREARLAMGVGMGATVLAWGYCLYYAWQILVDHNFSQGVNPFYPFLTPVMFVLALVLSIRRMFLHHWAALGRREFLAALLHPDPRALALRNLAIALCLGLGQGLVSVLGVSGVLPVPFDMYGISFFLLALIVMLVYSSWDHVTHQPDLIVKLIGLTLITLQATLGVVGLVDIHNAALQSESSLLQNVEVARRAVQVGDLHGLPVEIEYIVILPEAPTGEARLVYARDASRPTSGLLAGLQSYNAPVIWGYYYDYYIVSGRPRVAARVHTGDHLQGTYNQYVGYTFRGSASKNASLPGSDPQTYEVLFELTTANLPVHSTGLMMTGVILISNIFILLFFPLFFRSQIIAPLNRLLAGVSQANAGDLSVVVAVSQNDEIGFLTQSFNAMVASIQTQIDARRQKEAALQELTNTLEQRVASRTRELAVLYDVSAAASQAQTITTLLTGSLTQTMTALDSDLGAVYLVEDWGKDQSQGDTPRLKQVACRGICAEIDNLSVILSVNSGLMAQLFREREPVLVIDITTDARMPQSLQNLGRRSFLAAPLRGDERVLGVLMLIQKVGKTFSAEEVALLSSIADQIGLSVQSSSLRQQTVVLAERQHLAQDLHDSVTQVLYGLVTLAEAGQVRLAEGSREAIQTTFERIAATARQALNEMRLFVHRLRPSELDQQGLAAALSQRVAAVEGWSGVRIRLLVDDSIRLPTEVERELYQIAQEALNNALRHAHAGTITLKLQSEGQRTLLEINDDGRGFDPQQAQRGLGLTSMAERARAIHATFEVTTRPGEGTRMRVWY